MKTEFRKVYITDDGQEFDSEEEALKHEIVLNISRFLEDSDIHWRDIGPDDVAKYIVANRDALIKILSIDRTLEEE